MTMFWLQRRRENREKREEVLLINAGICQLVKLVSYRMKSLMLSVGRFRFQKGEKLPYMPLVRDGRMNVPLLFRRLNELLLIYITNENTARRTLLKVLPCHIILMRSVLFALHLGTRFDGSWTIGISSCDGESCQRK